MKESIGLLRRAAAIRSNDLTESSRAIRRDYTDTADLLEQLSKGDKGPNQVQVVTQENTVLNAESLLTAALFVGINPKAARNLVELVKYIQNLEIAANKARCGE